MTLTDTDRKHLRNTLRILAKEFGVVEFRGGTLAVFDMVIYRSGREWKLREVEVIARRREFINEDVHMLMAMLHTEACRRIDNLIGRCA